MKDYSQPSSQRHGTPNNGNMTLSSSSSSSFMKQKSSPFQLPIRTPTTLTTSSKNINHTAAATTTITTTNHSCNNNNEEVTRVWVRQSTIDSVSRTSSNYKSRSQINTTTPISTHITTGLVPRHSTSGKPQSSSSSSSSSLPSVVKSFVPTGPQPQQHQHHLLSQSTSSYSSSCCSTQVTLDLTLDGSSDGSIGNGGNHSMNHSPTRPIYTTTATTTTTTGRVMQWGWKEGVLLPSNTTTNHHHHNDNTITIQLCTNSNTSILPMVRGGAADMALPSSSFPSSTATIIQLPHSVLEEGNVVLANDRVDPCTGEILAAPNDLISLTHLHEPAVCMALQQRYESDLIYTNTGPVLLAINPFGLLPGMYGESIQRKYVDAAEKMNIQSLPPHVYAIADTAFRSMMRSIEDRSDQNIVVQQPHHQNNNNNNDNDSTTGSMSTTITTTTSRNQFHRTSLDVKKNDTTGTGKYVSCDTTPAVGASTLSSSSNTNTAVGRQCMNQSILISGESGSGKTVTTKFVMKYLAALSQRSVQIQVSSQERAYQKVHNNIDERNNNTKTVVPLSTSTTTNGVSNWRKGALSNGNGGSAASDLYNMSTGGSSSTTELTSNTIEAQVLQSNPILESFGNARTVRNDNSSRFGKFIEIQFTATGKLVGAVLQTYLLEKVRLNYQNDGERNYHIFYELLSGNMSSREISQFFLAPTANPDDFKLTNSSGTNTRRDGVSDRETCSGLLVAFNTMKFTSSDIQDVFGITAAILHASNLTFIDLNNDTCCLDESNVHFYPVCTLLGLTLTDLNQAICHCQLTAGEVNVTRSLSVAQAIIGLESLLKETYGALFQYLVKRINSQMAMVDDDCTTAAATIGVLDIFGFESFAVNSFEQLCINYCNEALQQQFNAFVLQNEQAEYEREGIQWSFIEFPENQDVLDLMEKRGSSVLSILDDQCKAPGPSDKAFCLAVYSQCSNKPRFSATRKQQALLQFSIHHYAGPVEYTVAGFTAKNKDEPPKETILLLRSSSKPLVQMLAALMEEALELPTPGEVDSSGEFKTTTTPKRLHRADSSMARPTVGGQFRSQLRLLRQKIDRTAPHYIRCLKPNDMLVPDHFDIAIVAEQLKCGGILEAVRVARAGFTQHYSHSDFCRRYRALAWKEMSASTAAYKTSTIRVPTPPKWNIPTSPQKGKSSRHSFPVSTFVPKSKSNTTTSNIQQQHKQVVELTAADAKAMCKDLLKVLYRKIERHGGAAVENVGAVASSSTETFDTPSPVAKAKTYSFKSPSATITPSWTSKARSPASPLVAVTPNAAPTPTTNGWKPRGTSSLITGADLAKVGIQMGKTKVFLRHKAFEVLERIRGSEQSMAATKLNSIFRRYLARIAYIPYRDAMRHARERQRQMKLASLGNIASGMEFDEFKEMKEQDFDDFSSNAYDGSGTTKRNFESARSSFYNNTSLYNSVGSDKWTELQIKEAIHNPVPRHEWGKQAPLDAEKFKWVIREGLWVKNYS